MSSLVVQYAYIFYILFGLIGAILILLLRYFFQFKIERQTSNLLIYIMVGFLIGTGLFLLLLSHELKQGLNETIAMASITLAFLGVAIGLLSIIDTQPEQQPRDRQRINAPFQNLVILLLFVLVSLFCGYFIGFHDAQISLSNKYVNDLDDFLEINYQKNAQSILNSNNFEITTLARTNYSDVTKLNLLAEKIVNNFSNPWWDNGTEFWMNEFNDNNLEYNHKYFGDVPFYGFDKNGRIRARPGAKFFLNSSWIETQNTGACLELAILFDEFAKRMGYETRIVHNPQVDHAWNEINISGVWYYADVDCYHNKGSTKWIGLRENYTDNCMCFPAISKIYIFPSEDPKDDISINYLKNYTYCTYFSTFS